MSMGKEFVITRTLDAPREVVFKAWTEAERLAQWWGPKGCAIEVGKLEVRPGGTFLYCMKMPNGSVMWGKFVFTDDTGKIIRSPFSATWPLEILNTLTLVERGGKTTLSLRGSPINPTVEERNTFESFFKSMEQGFGGTLVQLVEYLAKG